MSKVEIYKDNLVLNKNVLVGTCPFENINWIQNKGYYNLPIKNLTDESICTSVSHLIVLYYDDVIVSCETEFVEIKNYDWLEHRGYPKKDYVDDGEVRQYAIFKLGNWVQAEELISNIKNNIIVYTRALKYPIVLDDMFFSKEFCLSRSDSTDKIFTYLKPFFPRWNITRKYRQLCFSDFL